MNRCKTCKHWDTSKSVDTILGEWGECAKLTGDGSWLIEVNYCCEGDEGPVETRNTFGCVHWEAK